MRANQRSASRCGAMDSAANGRTRQADDARMGSKGLANGVCRMEPSPKEWAQSKPFLPIMTAIGLIDFGYGEGKTYAQLVLYGKRPAEAAR